MNEGASGIVVGIGQYTQCVSHRMNLLATRIVKRRTCLVELTVKKLKDAVPSEINQHSILWQTLKKGYSTMRTCVRERICVFTHEKIEMQTSMAFCFARLFANVRVCLYIGATPSRSGRTPLAHCSLLHSFFVLSE